MLGICDVSVVLEFGRYLLDDSYRGGLITRSLYYCEELNFSNFKFDRFSPANLE